MAFLIGALFGTFLISRLFWLAAKSWPDTNEKALFLNGVSGVFILIADYSTRSNADLVSELAIYGSCQMLILFFDLWRIARKKAITSRQLKNEDSS